MPTDLELAWFAGFFDGEGCIRGRAYWRHDKPTLRMCVNVSLVVTQRDREILEQICSIADCGHISKKTPIKNRTTTISYAYQWVAGGHSQIAILLNQLLPYLIVKKDQAIVALQLLTRLAPKPPGRGYRIPEEELDIRLDMLHQLSALKKSRQVYQGHQRRSL